MLVFIVVPPEAKIKPGIQKGAWIEQQLVEVFGPGFFLLPFAKLVNLLLYTGIADQHGVGGELCAQLAAGFLEKLFPDPASISLPV